MRCKKGLERRHHLDFNQDGRASHVGLHTVSVLSTHFKVQQSAYFQ